MEKWGRGRAGALPKRTLEVRGLVPEEGGARASTRRKEDRGPISGIRFF